ncbi:MAG: HEPN domain-containing protein [Candidatus Goldiibacteriota bacterium]
MKNIDEARNWLRRARSSHAHSGSGASLKNILLEDLCYDAQQAAEKALKALCIGATGAYPKTHDISHLMDLLEKKRLKIPEKVKKAKGLTLYAVQTRYPGDYEPVTKKEYKDAVNTAGEVIKWASKLLKDPG